MLPISVKVWLLITIVWGLLLPLVGMSTLDNARVQKVLIRIFQAGAVVQVVIVFGVILFYM